MPYQPANYPFIILPGFNRFGCVVTPTGDPSLRPGVVCGTRRVSRSKVGFEIGWWISFLQNNISIWIYFWVQTPPRIYSLNIQKLSFTWSAVKRDREIGEHTHFHVYIYIYIYEYLYIYIEIFETSACITSCLNMFKWLSISKNQSSPASRPTRQCTSCNCLSRSSDISILSHIGIST